MRIATSTSRCCGSAHARLEGRCPWRLRTPPQPGSSAPPGTPTPAAAGGSTTSTTDNIGPKALFVNSFVVARYGKTATADFSTPRKVPLAPRFGYLAREGPGPPGKVFDVAAATSNTSPAGGCGPLTGRVYNHAAIQQQRDYTSSDPGERHRYCNALIRDFGVTMNDIGENEKPWIS